MCHFGCTAGKRVGSIIYINDLPDVIPNSVSIRLFADDCIVFKQIRKTSDHGILQASLTAIDKWCVERSMKLNVKKTVLLRVTRKKHFSPFTYSLQGSDIKEVASHKYLGLTLTNQLDWSPHISQICSSAFSTLCFLKRKLNRAPSNIKFLAYNTFIRTKLEYASIIWDPHTKKNITALEMIQRKAVRFIFHKYSRSDSPTQLMVENDIPLLSVRRKMNTILFLGKILSQEVNIPLPNFVQPSTARRTRHTREHMLQPVFARTNSFKYSFFPRTISDWNLLSEFLFQSSNFNKALEGHLFG